VGEWLNGNDLAKFGYIIDIKVGKKEKLQYS
jgi:hypothetical protein